MSATLAPDELRRLRWRARRGLLENDLIIERWLAARDRLDAGDARGLSALLDLPDNDLLDLLLGRSAVPAAIDSDDVRRVLAGLREQPAHAAAAQTA